jgi:ribosome-associated protein
MALGRPVDVPIREESIRLGQFLKLADLVEAGSDAKELISAGEVLVNGEPEIRRGRQLRSSTAGRPALPGGQDRLPSEQVITNGGDPPSAAVERRAWQGIRPGAHSSPPQVVMSAEVRMCGISNDPGSGDL